MGEKKILLFYTFCCYIGRIEKNHLIRALNLLLNSIHKHIPNYKLICYRNFFFNNMLTKNIKKNIILNLDHIIIIKEDFIRINGKTCHSIK